MKKNSIIFLIILISSSACKKYLDAKPSDSLAVPTTPSDLQAILDSYDMINNSYPTASEAQSDNYYVLPTSYTSLTDDSRNIYAWKKEDRPSSSWVYTSVYQTNVVLDELVKMERTGSNAAQYDNVLGSALFLRATYFYALSQIYAPPYSKSASGEQYGIPLRTNSDYTILSTRSTIQQTYDRIIEDFKKAIDFLPMTPLLKTRPSKPAAFGSLARVYLAMGEYQLAEQYADSCLKYYNKLLDYTKLSTTAAAPIPQFNDEIIFHIRSLIFNEPILNPSIARIDSSLYASYDVNDLRKAIFFRSAANNTFTFKGDYDAQGSSDYIFGGIVTDEIYLTRAECRARRGEIDGALSDLNTLLATRWKSGTFVKITAPTKEDALRIILQERRKELISRGTRWTDLRRLMNDPIGTTTPKRKINNDIIQLEPNSPRYTLQIPLVVMQRTNMSQNP